MILNLKICFIFKIQANFYQSIINILFLINIVVLVDKNCIYIKHMRKRWYTEPENTKSLYRTQCTFFSHSLLLHSCSKLNIEYIVENWKSLLSRTYCLMDFLTLRKLSVWGFCTFLNQCEHFNGYCYINKHVKF